MTVEREGLRDWHRLFGLLLTDFFRGSPFTVEVERDLSIAAPDLVQFGSGAYRPRSRDTSGLLVQLFEQIQSEGFAMSYTMEDFRRQFVKEHFPQLTPEEQREALERLSPEHRREVLRSLLPEDLLGALSAEQIREYLDRLTAGRPEQPRRPRRKK